MKVIGLLGGTSWPSTIEYYKLLNQIVSEKLGGRHSAEIILRSIDFHEMRTSYETDWDKVILLLKARLIELADCKPDIIVICNNALHKALDEIAPTPNFRGIPIIHIADETGKHLKNVGASNVLMLSTKMIMEDPYYSTILGKYGITTTIPELDERIRIQEIQTRAALGKETLPDDVAWLRALLDKYAKICDSAVLACTELPIVFSGIKDAPIKLVNPTEIQCVAASNLALNQRLER